ncbi:hypothetical protein Tco_1201884 [Tanacetum coccineum]
MGVFHDLRVSSKAHREGVWLHVADSHTGNHPEDGFTPLKTIRRLFVVIGRRSYSGFEGEAFEPGDEGTSSSPLVEWELAEKGNLFFFLPSMDSKFTFASQTCTLTRERLNQFVIDFDIPQDVKVILPKRWQTILDAPLGYVGLYTHHFSHSNLRLPIPPFICKGCADVPNALHNPITHLGNWKGSFFFIENKIIPSNYPELLLGENKLDKKSFKDKTPFYTSGLKTTWEHSPKKPVIYHRGQEMDFRSFMLGGVDGELNFLPAEGASKGQNSPSVKFVNNNAPVIDATPLSSVYPSNVVENVVVSDDPSYGEDEQTLIGPSLSPHPEASKKFKILGKRKVAFSVPGKALPLKVQKVPARASKVAGEASTTLDVDSDSDIHEFPSAKELKDVTDYHWVVAHVTPPSWKQNLREISIEQLHNIHNRAYIRQVILDNLDKDRAYAKLERKYNEALQDLDKNPLVSDMHFEEVAVMEEPFVLEKMLSYQPSLKEEYDQAGDALANASYPFLTEYVANLYASLEQLLSKKPPLL